MQKDRVASIATVNRLIDAAIAEVNIQLPEIHGSPDEPILIDASVGLIPTSASVQVWYVAGDGLPIDEITSVPQIAPGFEDGQFLEVDGTDIVNYVVFNDGNGLDQNGPQKANAGSAILYRWIAATRVWHEITRR